MAEDPASLEKSPPHDIAAEEAVLGSFLVDGSLVDRVAAFLHAEDFFRDRNRWVYEACLSLFERAEAINEVTVAHELDVRNRLEAVGGASYLSELVANLPTSVHAEHYAQIVQRTATLRRLISAAGEIASIGYEGGPDVEGALAQAEDILFRLREGQRPRDFVPLRDVLSGYLDDISAPPEVAIREGGAVGSGFVDLDRLLGGLHPSDMVVIAARPSLGKSSLALNIARNAARRHGAHVAIFSLEMSSVQLAHRLLAIESGVDSQRIRLGQHAPSEERRIMEAAGALSELPIFIDDSAVLRPVELRSKARRLQSERGLHLVIVDYLQIMDGTSRTDNRVQEMSEISRRVKALARDLHVPVVAISQLSRAVEARSPKVPILSDLRESGSIEQDADVVLFIYRDDVYFTREEWERRHATEPYPEGIANIIVAKHRNGPTGDVNLRFFKQTGRFADLSTRVDTE